jgi:hypothetical protein
MAAKNTNRATAIVTYLDSALSSDYYVTRNISEANGTGSAKRIVLVRWYRRAPEGVMNTSEDRSDRLYFSLIGLPIALDDYGMSDECDQIEEDLLDAIRDTTAYSVFNGLSDGRYIGWRATGSVKAPNRKGQLAVEVEVEIAVEEEAS